MNIQLKNSAHHFRMQSEREQTLGMCSFQHKWASERQLYLFVLLHHVIMN